MTFGERLEKSIKESNYTQKELADKIGITPVRLNYWVKDKRQPDVHYIKLLANALNVSADYLIGNDCPAAEPVLSSAALALAAAYDSLDDHGKHMLDTVARIEVERISQPKPKPLPAGIMAIGDMPMYKIPYLGEAVCDGSIETKHAAKSELAEMQTSEPLPVE